MHTHYCASCNKHKKCDVVKDTTTCTSTASNGVVWFKPKMCVRCKRIMNLVFGVTIWFESASVAERNNTWMSN